MTMDELEGEFIIKEKGELRTYTKVRDLPDTFDHLIKFKVNDIPSPHTEEQHNEMSKYSEYLHTLMTRERK
tara:strand:- start:196 stop:408 length:213 start_codon:yes stop_codon:yes gene_type:complete